MNRIPLTLLRPCLRQGFNPRPCNAVQRRFKVTEADKYLGPLPIEKQIRLDSLRWVQPLTSYHPRWVTSDRVDFSVQDFISKYEGIEKTSPDDVRVFGMRHG
jgi:hypothetical protein